MVNFLKTYAWLLIPLFFWSGKKTAYTVFKTKQYSISINHPGEKEPVDILIYQVFNKEGISIQYYMDVPSVICLEEVCKIIPVRLFWNNLGEYQKYELEKGATLEKYKADLFEPQDYIKLQNILSDEDSPFKEVYFDEILTVPTSDEEEDVDAVSGATALELNEEDTVPGAALGCYTLWHWANGEIVQKIRDLTGKVLTENQLLIALTDKNRAYYKIGIKELTNRKNYKKKIVDTIIKETLKDKNLLKTTFNYLNIAAASIYFKAINQIFTDGKKPQKLATIRSLQYSKHKATSKYLDDLSNKISSLKSYQEVSTFLDLMQSKNPNSKNVINNTIPLLQSKDFIIARRVYWFLKNQDVTISQKKLLHQFYQKYKERL